MFDLRFINVAADDTYCMAAAKATRSLLAAEDMVIVAQPKTDITVDGQNVAALVSLTM